jgi:hypothetical protein
MRRLAMNRELTNRIHFEKIKALTLFSLRKEKGDSKVILIA